MPTAVQFYNELEEHGFNFFTGVPCTIFKSLIGHLEVTGKYVAASREDEALGICTGAFLVGKKPVLIMQNSGLGNSINALCSLALLYEIPILLLISWRGFLGKDAPEHLYMGKSMLSFLKEMEIPTYLYEEDGALEKAVLDLNRMKKPVAVIVKNEGIK